MSMTWPSTGPSSGLAVIAADGRSARLEPAVARLGRLRRRPPRLAPRSGSASSSVRLGRGRRLASAATSPASASASAVDLGAGVASGCGLRLPARHGLGSTSGVGAIGLGAARPRLGASARRRPGPVGSADGRRRSARPSRGSPSVVRVPLRRAAWSARSSFEPARRGQAVVPVEERLERGEVGDRPALELELELEEPLDDASAGHDVDLVEAQLDGACRPSAARGPADAGTGGRDELDQRRVAAQLEDQRARRGRRPADDVRGPVGRALELLAPVERAVAALPIDLTGSRSCRSTTSGVGRRTRPGPAHHRPSRRSDPRAGSAAARRWPGSRPSVSALRSRSPIVRSATAYLSSISIGRSTVMRAGPASRCPAPGRCGATPARGRSRGRSPSSRRTCRSLPSLPVSSSVRRQTASVAELPRAPVVGQHDARRSRRSGPGPRGPRPGRPPRPAGRGCAP